MSPFTKKTSSKNKANLSHQPHPHNTGEPHFEHTNSFSINPKKHFHITESLSTRTILFCVLILIFSAATFIAFSYTSFIRDFLKNTRATTITNFVQQAAHHLDKEKNFASWQDVSSQEAFKSVATEITNSYPSALGLEFHTPDGVLIWSSFKTATIGTNEEQQLIQDAVAHKKIFGPGNPVVIKELGVSDIEEVYVPIYTDAGVVVGVVDTYLNLSDVTRTTTYAELVLWLIMVLAAIIIIALLYLAFRYKDNEIIKQAQELENFTHTLEQKVYDRTQDLASEKNKAEVLLTSLGEGIIGIDAQGVITTVNHRAAAILKTHVHEVLGKKIDEVVPAQDSTGNPMPPEKRPYLVAMMTQTSITQDNIYFILNDGTKVPVRVVASPIGSNKKITGVVIVFNDISKEKEDENTRRNFISIASHQLRTPLTGIKWLLETLKKKNYGPLTKKQEEYVDEIYKTNERLMFLVHDILNLLQVEDGVTVAKKERAALSMIFEATQETLHASAERKNITLVMPPNVSLEIVTDPLLLRTILETLLSNAINYSNPGEKVVVSLDSTTAEHIISVKDQGIGIPKEAYPHLFDRFYRAENAKDFDVSGTGLGLYIASLLAQKLNVKLSFDSEVDKGTTFYIHIPNT